MQSTPVSRISSMSALAPRGGQPGRPHVLVIDADPEVCGLYSMLLASRGYQVSVLPEETKSLDQVLAIAPDLIVLDHLWYDLTGSWAFLEALRSHPITAGIPVIASSTTMGDTEPYARHLAAIGVPLVHKPFDVRQVLSLVASLTGPAPHVLADAPAMATLA